MEKAAAARIMAAEPTVFFLGSGVSVPAPSCLPPAYKAAETFLRQLGSGLVPDDVIKTLLGREYLPEFVYGLCERYLGPAVYDVWGALEQWRDVPGAFGPTPGHLVAVHRAQRSGTPIITPNFDTYLEEAAEQLGMAATVTVARPGHEFAPPRRPDPRAVQIWKLHGTATDPRTVFSSVRTLTAPTSGIRKHLSRAIGGDRRLVIAGYSGRDLDLFPYISAKPLRAPALWVDMYFPDDHRSSLLQPQAEQITAGFDAVALPYLALLDDGVLSAAVEQAVDRVRMLSGGDEEDRFKERVLAHFRSSAAALAAPDRVPLVFAELLINAGMSGAAISLLESHAVATDLEQHRSRLAAKALWQMGRHRTSREFAEGEAPFQASRVAEFLLRSEADAAFARETVPPYPIGAGAARGMISAARRGLSSLPAVLSATPIVIRPSRLSEPDRTAFVEAWLEHVIRLGAGGQRLLFVITRGSSWPFAWLLRRVWAALRSACVRAGYAQGAGNTARYAARLGVESGGEIDRFLGYQLGRVIFHRDRATAVVAYGVVDDALQDYLEGVKLARDKDDPVLLMTFKPLADRLGQELQLADEVWAQVEADWVPDLRALWDGARIE